MITIYEEDSLNVLVTVQDQQTSQPLNLTGATVEIVAGRFAGESVQADADILDPKPNGQIAGSFPAGALRWDCGVMNVDHHHLVSPRAERAIEGT
ncbi:hypothetical protein [Ruegeria sp. AU67]|uniref:hypothetical protein n=1 Tax=Ruegeria sp. AU67 TaxID=2108530 RepID=UPI00135C423D|nr:hypothetical protein [Ruegeria sp. AU67]